MGYHRFFLLMAVAWLVTTGGALARPTIVIDAGHGGHDRGGIAGMRYSEKVYALDVARRVSAKLRAAGFRTVMTRKGDYFVSLSGRCAAANRHRDAVFVSVHFNAASRRGADGIETYYYGRRAYPMAAAVHTRLVAAAGTEDRGVRRRGFYVLRHTRCPAILVEGGFLSNPREGARIAQSASHRQKLADAIARGVIATYR
ncbi:MAG: N-acetylmuramoyl-L-alanine amidase [Verrucomicrobiales bacterium]